MKLESIQEALLTLTYELKELKFRVKSLEGKGLPSFQDLEARGLKPAYIPTEPKVTFEGEGD